MQSNSFDYIVVGGGAAGCVVAARLSEDSNTTVALLEAGDQDRSPLLRVPGASVFAASRFTWNFLSEPVSGLSHRRLPLSQGRVLGGSSSINGMVFVRGHSSEYDAWERMGCRGWGFSGLLPYFRKVETNARGGSRLHGDAGPIRVSPAGTSVAIPGIFLDAANEAGFSIVEDLNCDIVDGFGRYDVNVDRGRRQSSARTYLKTRPKNLTIITRAHATRILFEQRKAVGVEIIQRGQLRSLKASREIVLSAGSLNSPQILMLSGIGPAAHLKHHGIDVIVDNPFVGAHLQNHPVYGLHYAISKPITAFKYLHPYRGAMMMMSYVFGRRGFLATPPFPVGGFLRSDNALQSPDIQVIVTPALALRTGNSFRGVLPKQHGVTAYVEMPAAQWRAPAYRL